MSRQSVHEIIVQVAPQLAFFGLSTLSSIPLLFVTYRNVNWTFRGRHDKWATGLLIGTIIFEFLAGIFFIGDDGYDVANLTGYSSNYNAITDEALEIFGILCDLIERSVFAALLYRIASNFLKVRIRYDDDGSKRKTYWFVSRVGGLLVLALALTSATQFIIEAVFVYNQYHGKGYYNLVMPESEFALIFSVLLIFLMLPMFLTLSQMFREMRISSNSKTLTLFGLGLLSCSLENTFRIASTAFDIETWRNPRKIFGVGLQTSFTCLVIFFQFVSIVFLTLLGCTGSYEERLIGYLDAHARPAMGIHDQFATMSKEYDHLSSAPSSRGRVQGREPVELRTDQRPSELSATYKPNELQSDSMVVELQGEINELGDGRADSAGDPYSLSTHKLKPDPEGFRNNSSMGLDVASRTKFVMEKLRNASILR